MSTVTTFLSVKLSGLLSFDEVAKITFRKVHAGYRDVMLLFKTVIPYMRNGQY